MWFNFEGPFCFLELTVKRAYFIDCGIIWENSGFFCYVFNVISFLMMLENGRTTLDLVLTRPSVLVKGPWRLMHLAHRLPLSRGGGEFGILNLKICV